MPPPVPGTPATVCIAHPVFLFLVLFPPHCRVRLSVSSTDNITIASMFLGPKNATNMFSQKHARALWRRHWRLQIWDLILGARKLVLRGTSSHGSDLPLEPHREAKASPSHLPVHLLQASCPGSHTHSMYIYIYVISFPTHKFITPYSCILNSAWDSILLGKWQRARRQLQC